VSRFAGKRSGLRGFLYFAESADRKAIKIGFTNSLVARASNLRSEPDAYRRGGIRIFAYREATWDEEQRLHVEMATYQMRSFEGKRYEWYRRCPEVTALIRGFRPHLRRWNSGLKRVRLGDGNLYFVDKDGCLQSSVARMLTREGFLPSEPGLLFGEAHLFRVSASVGVQ
jgi:hypothetical protein